MYWSPTSRYRSTDIEPPDGRLDRIFRRGRGRTGSLTRPTHGVHPAAHPPRLPTAAAHPAPEPQNEEPPPAAARRRWSRCRAPGNPNDSVLSAQDTSRCLADDLFHARSRQAGPLHRWLMDDATAPRPEWWGGCQRPPLAARVTPNRLPRHLCHYQAQASGSCSSATIPLFRHADVSR